MSIRQMAHPIDDEIKVSNVLVSVFDKSNLGLLVEGIRDVNPEATFFSTGGTYKKLREILGGEEGLVAIESYTDVPEMEGGLVKTLSPLIFAGLLGERNNPAHQAYLALMSRRMRFANPEASLETVTPGETYNVTFEEGDGVFFDMAVVNLYPFSDVRRQVGTTFEDWRGNIDIGGPSMIRAAAKNFTSVAPVVDPKDYHRIASHLAEHGSTTDFALRLQLMQRAFMETHFYDRDIDAEMAQVNKPLARKCYTFR